MNRQLSPKKSKKWWWIISISLALVLIIAAIIKGKSRPKGTEVYLEKVTSRDIIETVSASGKIYPEKEIKISSDVSGEVVELYVKEGDSVKAGQILARVNPDMYQSAVERSTAGVSVARSQAGASQSNVETARANRDQVKAQYENAVKSYRRNLSLFKEGIISQMDLDASETAMKNLESNLRAAENSIKASQNQAQSAGFQVRDAEAVLKEQKTNLGRTTLKAPADGIVSKLNVEKGERVVGTIQMSGTEIMRIADLGAMEVQVEVSENDIVRVKTGQTADIEVDAYQNKKFKGTVTEVANSASNLGVANALSTDQVTKFVVKIRIDKESYKNLVDSKNGSPFKPGMTATVDIITNQVKSVLSVPITAVTAYDLREEEKKKREKLGNNSNEIGSTDQPVHESEFMEAVFLQKGDTCARIDVTTGIQDENFIEIKSGLKPEDIVVIGPYSAIAKSLKNGDRIKEKKEESKKKTGSE